MKFVETSDEEGFLYDPSADPGESRDLGGERPAELTHMRARMAEARTRLGLPALAAPLAAGAGAPELDAATREQLRALGYAE